MNQLFSRTDTMQIPVWLVQILKQGKISLQANGKEKLQLRIANNKIDLNFLQKEQLKNILELESEMESQSIIKRLKTLENLAEKLKQNGFTITISHKGQTMLTLGSEAHPTVSQMITGTNAIEINNLIELIKIVE